MTQGIHAIAQTLGHDIPYEDCMTLVGLALEEEHFVRAWRCFLEHGAAFVEVTARNFKASFPQWVVFSGPADISWKR